MDPKARETIEILKKTIHELAGPGAYVITDDSMNREEQEMELFAGFLKDGYPRSGQGKGEGFSLTRRAISGQDAVGLKLLLVQKTLRHRPIQKSDGLLDNKPSFPFLPSLALELNHERGYRLHSQLLNLAISVSPHYLHHPSGDGIDLFLV